MFVKLSRHLWLVGGAALLAAGLACGPTGGEATSAPVKSGGGGSSGGADASGDYKVSGTNPDGSAYTGTLNVAKDGDIYRLSWKIGSSTVPGAALDAGGGLGVAYPSDKCVLAVYQEQDNANTLNGRWVAAASTTANTETATINQTDKSKGIVYFDLTGKNPDGSNYTGTMGLTVAGDLFHVAQKSGNTELIGTGLEVNKFFVVSFGASEGCGVVYYDLSGGKLTGKWGVYSISNKLGNEIATKQ